MWMGKRRGRGIRGLGMQLRLVLVGLLLGAICKKYLHKRKLEVRRYWLMQEHMIYYVK